MKAKTKKKKKETTDGRKAIQQPAFYGFRSCIRTIERQKGKCANACVNYGKINVFLSVNLVDTLPKLCASRSMQFVATRCDNRFHDLYITCVHCIQTHWYWMVHQYSSHDFRFTPHTHTHTIFLVIGIAIITINKMFLNFIIQSYLSVFFRAHERGS